MPATIRIRAINIMENIGLLLGRYLGLHDPVNDSGVSISYVTESSKHRTLLGIRELDLLYSCDGFASMDQAEQLRLVIQSYWH